MEYTVSLKKNRDFMKVYKRGSFFVGKYMTLYVLKNTLNVNHLGITVSKKVGNSVKRNRIKRLIRENYRLMEAFIKRNFNYVVVARKNDKMPEFIEIKRELKYLLRKQKAFEQEKWELSKSV